MKTATLLALILAGFAVVGTVDYRAAAGMATEHTPYAIAGR
jgi:hypothetical protein